MRAWLDLLHAELTRSLRDPVLRIAVVVLFLLALVGLAEGTLRATEDAALGRRITEEDTHELEELRAELAAPSRPVPRWADPRSPGVVGARLAARHVQLPARPLALLAVGQRDLVPHALRIALSAEPLGERIETLDDPRSMAQGPFDLAFVLVFLLPLVALALSYDLVSSERERGTLALLLAEAVRFEHVMLAKLAVRGLVLVTVVAGLVLVVAVLGVVVGTGVDGIGLGLVWLIGCLYGLFWFAVMLAISTLHRSSAANAMLGVCAWVGLVIFVPTACNVALQIAFPVPSRVELIETRRAAQREAAERAETQLDRYYEDHPSQASESDQDRYWPLSVWKTRHVLAAVASAERHHREQVQHQTERAGWQQLLSPAAVLAAALEEIAGTGAARQRAFEAQARAYHERYRETFEARILAGERFAAEDIETIPTFVFDDEARGIVLARTAKGAVALFLPTLLLAFVGVRGLRRTRISVA